MFYNSLKIKRFYGVIALLFNTVTSHSVSILFAVCNNSVRPKNSLKIRDMFLFVLFTTTSHENYSSTGNEKCDNYSRNTVPIHFHYTVQSLFANYGPTWGIP